jgi:hypothetical protein
MKRVDKDRAILFRDRAEQFMLAMNEMMELHDEDLASILSAIGLLAVHSAISLADAVLVHHVGQRSDGDHARAAAELKALSAGRRIKDQSGIQTLKGLLGEKNEFAYNAKYLTTQDAKSAFDQARSFATWTFTNFKEIRGTKEEPDGKQQ